MPRSPEELVQAEDMLDNMICEFESIEGAKEEVSCLREAQAKLHKKLKALYPDAKWSF